MPERSELAGAASSWVCRHAPLIRSGGTVLDLACGRGRHARRLAEKGFRVCAVDRDAAALAGLAGMPGIETLCADLEAGAWPLPGRSFDGIVVARYLHRPLLPAIAAALAPDGVLIYETFMLGNERYGRPSNPDFLLLPGELRQFAADAGLEIVASAEGFVAEPEPAMVQSLCARRLRVGASVVLRS